MTDAARPGTRYAETACTRSVMRISFTMRTYSATDPPRPLTNGDTTLSRFQSPPETLKDGGRVWTAQQHHTTLMARAWTLSHGDFTGHFLPYRIYMNT